MKRTPVLFLCLLSLLVFTGCSGSGAPTQSAAEKKPIAEQYADGRSECSAQADSKLGLFDRPDTYPISDQERNNARTALFNECMRAHEPQVAGIPKSDTQANAQDTAALAALSPAAGGNPPQNAATAYPSGSTVIMVQGGDVSQLAGLSPAAGGNPLQSGINSPYPGATVVVVQAPSVPPPPPARPPVVMPTALARPVAIPAQQPAVTEAHTLAAPQTSRSLPVATGDQDTQELEQILTK